MQRLRDISIKKLKLSINDTDLLSKLAFHLFFMLNQVEVKEINTMEETTKPETPATPTHPKSRFGAKHILASIGLVILILLLVWGVNEYYLADRGEIDDSHTDAESLAQMTYTPTPDLVNMLIYSINKDDTKHVYFESLEGAKTYHTFQIANDKCYMMLPGPKNTLKAYCGSNKVSYIYFGNKLDSYITSADGHYKANYDAVARIITINTTDRHVKQITVGELIELSNVTNDKDYSVILDLVAILDSQTLFVQMQYAPGDMYEAFLIDLDTYDITLLPIVYSSPRFDEQMNIYYLSYPDWDLESIDIRSGQVTQYLVGDLHFSIGADEVSPLLGITPDAKHVLFQTIDERCIGEENQCSEEEKAKYNTIKIYDLESRSFYKTITMEKEKNYYLLHVVAINNEYMYYALHEQGLSTDPRQHLFEFDIETGEIRELKEFGLATRLISVVSLPKDYFD